MPNQLLDALGWIGSSLDKPGAALRGLLAGRPDQLANLIPFSDTAGLTNPEERTRGTDLLGVDPESTGGMLGGMATEMALDPLNLLMGAGIARNLMKGRAMKGAYQGELAAFPGKQAAFDAAEAERQAALAGQRQAEFVNAQRAKMLGSGGMPEEIAAQTKAVDASGQPAKTYHGTGAVFDKYDPAKDAPELLYGPGYYSTESPGVASGYAGRMERRPQTSLDRQGVRDELQYRVEKAISKAGGIDNMEQEPAFLRRAAQEVARARGKPPQYLLDELGAAGVDLSDLPSLKASYKAPHVRSQFLDYRNPFDIEKSYSAEDLAALSEKLPVRRRALLEPAIHPDVLSRGGMGGDTLYHTLLTGNPNKVEFGLQPQLSQDLWNAGYDAIKHHGGGYQSTHQVHIVPRPEQIYNPWIIPTEQAMPVIPPLPTAPLYPQMGTPPRVSPLMASLLGQNVLGRSQ